MALPITLLYGLLIIIIGFLTDLLAGIFWSCSELISKVWNMFPNTAWKVFTVLISPFLIIAGILGAPYILYKLQGYVVFRNTKAAWYSAGAWLPETLRCCCR